MNKLKIADKFTRAFGKAELKFKKYSPEILVVTGIVGVVASTVLACKATTKATKIVADTKKDLNNRREYVEHPEMQVTPYTKDDLKKDTKIVYAQTGLQLAKVYAPAVTVGALSITCILASNNMLRRRSAALAAAYATVDKSFKEYRDRVIERFGKELDRELKYNIKTKEVEEKIIDENGKEKTVKNKVAVVEGDNPGEYSYFFDVGSCYWEKDAEKNKWFLVQQQNWANEKLKSRGYLFLNEVLEALDIPVCKAGQIVGWIYDEKKSKGDGYVDFGIFNISREANRRFVNGVERTILLDFNVDGPIIDLI